MPGKYQKKDHLYHQAKDVGWRSRAAFKLIELDQKYKLLRKGSAVLDLGAAPGGWMQVAARKVGREGTVVGVDLELVPSFSLAELGKESAIPLFIQGDITAEATWNRIREIYSERFDLVVSDMSPKLSGIRDRDLAHSIALVERCHTVCQSQLRKGGSFVAKVFAGADTDELYEQLRPSFKKLFRVHPKASRKTSTELYFVGLGFGLVFEQSKSESK